MPHAKPPQPVRVLFVCTGNICRSPTAEGVLRRLVRDQGLEGRVEVDSAGTFGYHVGEPPDRRSIRAAAARGYDLSALRARTVTREDFARFDLLLALDRGHRRELEQLAPDGAAARRIRLLLDYAPAFQGQDVPDPYYGGPADFERVLDLAEAGSRGLLEALRRDYLGPA